MFRLTTDLEYSNLGACCFLFDLGGFFKHQEPITPLIKQPAP